MQLTALLVEFPVLFLDGPLEINLLLLTLIDLLAHGGELLLQ